MVDRVPDYRNRLAHLISIVFHPFVIALPTMLVVLRNVPPDRAVYWSLLIILILVVPLAACLFILRQRGKYSYQRKTRLPLYLVAWASILICLVVTAVFHAPLILVACMTALAIWVPLQFAINTWVTKISIHTAVITGCVLALLLLNTFTSPVLQLVALGPIPATAWARMVTRNHTGGQVLLGIFTGAMPVLVVFPLLLNR